LRNGVFFKISLLISIVGIFGGAAAFWNTHQLASLDDTNANLSEARKLNEVVQNVISSINSINLAAMDAIVDKDSGTVAEELIEEYQINKKNIESLKTNLTLSFEITNSTQNLSKTLGDIDNLLAATESLFYFVNKKSKSSSLFAELDDRIDSSAVSAKESLRSVSGLLIEEMNRRSIEFVEESDSTQFWIITNSVLLVLILIGVGSPIALTIVRPLNNVTGSISHSASTLTDVQLQIEQSQNELKSVVDQQAAAIHQTTAAMQETERSLEKGLEFLNESLRFAKNTKDKSQSGENVMNSLFESMTSLKDASAALTNMISILKEIESKTDFINSIVFKTQMLSVNASIEAARAGQHGKGFSVVAVEVGNLAKLSGESAIQINSLLKNGIGSANNLVKDITQRISSTLENNKEALAVFKEIATDMTLVTEKLESLENSQGEQNSAISMTLTAMGDLNKGAVKCSEVADQFGNLTNSLSLEVDRLQTDVNRTKEVVFGQNRPALLQLAKAS
jgi:methyl-accepting chemotaxis protein